MSTQNRTTHCPTKLQRKRIIAGMGAQKSLMNCMLAGTDADSCPGMTSEAF